MDGNTQPCPKPEDYDFTSIAGAAVYTKAFTAWVIANPTVTYINEQGQVYASDYNASTSKNHQMNEETGLPLCGKKEDDDSLNYYGARSSTFYVSTIALDDIKSVHFWCDKCCAHEDARFF